MSYNIVHINKGPATKCKGAGVAKINEIPKYSPLESVSITDQNGIHSFYCEILTSITTLRGVVPAFSGKQTFCQPC